MGGMSLASGLLDPASTGATVAYPVLTFVGSLHPRIDVERSHRRGAVQRRHPTSRQPRALRPLGMAEVEPNDVGEVTKRLLERAAQARAEAEEMEITLRKEQGNPDFVPSTNKISSAGDSPGEGVATALERTQTAQTQATVTEFTPETRKALVEQLENLPPDSKEVIAKMDELKGDGLAPRWNSFDVGASYPISQGQLKMQTGLDGKALAADGGSMDDLKWALGGVCLFSFTAAVGFGSAIGGNVGASFTYFFALLPIVFLGIGSTAPGIITAVIDNFKRKSQEDFEERRVRHEAAHFLSGYLCGLPIKSYRAEGGTTLVEFYDSVDGDMGGRALKFTKEEVDKVSIVAMSGAVGEAREFGTATGGAADLDNLGQIMNQSKDPMDAKAQQAQARWAALMAHKLITTNEPELKCVMDAFRSGKPVSECVAALEAARA